MAISLAILLTIITFLTYKEHFKTITFQVDQREYYLLNMSAARRVIVNIDIVEQKPANSTSKSASLFMTFYFNFRNKGTIK